MTAKKPKPEPVTPMGESQKVGYFGDKVDPRPNNVYTVQGQFKETK